MLKNLFICQVFRAFRVLFQFPFSAEFCNFSSLFVWPFFARHFHFSKRDKFAMQFSMNFDWVSECLDIFLIYMKIVAVSETFTGNWGQNGCGMSGYILLILLKLRCCRINVMDSL